MDYLIAVGNDRYVISKISVIMKNVLILGLGISGRAAADFLLDRSCAVTAIDQRFDQLENDSKVVPLIGKGLKLQRDLVEGQMEEFDLLVISPGVPPAHPLLVAAKRLGIEAIGEIELACRHLKQPMIAVTGTNGKTTVTLLIGHVLNACGVPAKVLGNGGVPLISEVSQLDDEIVVCELSSYQLETLQCKVVDIGAILNITPDHLDRYPDMEEYARAKFRLADCLKPGKKLYVSKQVMQAFRHLIANSKEIIEEINLDNYNSCLNHDEENLLAARIMCREFGVTDEDFDHAAKSFAKPPHRIEFVRKRQGVAYYNDSKGTNLDSVKRAVEMMDGPVVLIAGGKEKGTSFTPWIESFKGKVKVVLAIGEARNRLISELGDSFIVIDQDGLKRAVETASKIADEGDNVLLSPGCASFDMFENFEERGNFFKKYVGLLD